MRSGPIPLTPVLWQPPFTVEMHLPYDHAKPKHGNNRSTHRSNRGDDFGWHHATPRSP
ncbi:MAG: hypothetical protein HOH36_01610 [Acidimicrobiaceae bacterium]|nr:hypothetical protein [Acidimicrobiaceae bacterium]MBT5849109.1 hypothetical protein [Acidimicrobiaceae bacterium]